jgi:D-lactate dehydrogenase (cytochrome)
MLRRTLPSFRRTLIAGISASGSSSSWWSSAAAISAATAVSFTAVYAHGSHGHNSPMPAAAPIPDDMAKEIAEIFGARFTVDGGELERHGKDEHSYHAAAPPSGVVYPHSTEEVSKLLKICNKYAVPIIPYGSGTSLEGHTSAPSGGICIDMREMDKILTLHEKDLDVVVQPGIHWEDLNTKLAPSGLFFPVDPGPGASIGGMVATGCSGTNAYRYGTMRMNVLNLTVVLADGTILKTAQRARKSSAGYNLTGLFVGSEGTLGIVTEATLRLQKIPDHKEVVLCAFNTLHDASDAVIEILQNGLQVGCMELMDDAMMQAVNKTGGFNFDALPTLLFKFTGTDAQVKDNVSRVEAIVQKHKNVSWKWAGDHESADNLWHARKGALWAAQNLREDGQVNTTDVCVPISKLADVIAETQKDIKESGIPAPIVGHVGDGNFHVFFVFDPNNPEELAKVKDVNHKMVYRAIDAEGTCTGEHGVGVGKMVRSLDSLISYLI